METKPEKYLSAKELSGALDDICGPVHEDFIRAMMRAGIPRLGNKAKLSSVIAWWEAHPDFVARPAAANRRKCRASAATYAIS